MALYDFQAGGENQLSLKKGEQVSDDNDDERLFATVIDINSNFVSVTAALC